ncbi:MAG: cytochrome c [Gammaproteobacteria bacterium]|nr:MAG: cytochrome c [Gammaproteobacteria bacterium]
MKSAPILLASLLLALSSLPAQALSPQRRAELKNLVLEDCGACHGSRLKGGLGPSLLPERLGRLPDALLEQTILEGRPGTPMPPWKAYLTPEEARWIVRQLKQGSLLPH